MFRRHENPSHGHRIRRIGAVGAALAVMVGLVSGLTVSAPTAGAATTSTTFAAWVNLNNSVASLTQSADASITPSSITQGGNYTLTAAGGTQVIPTSNGGVPVIYATNNNNMYALPPGVTFVSATNGSYTFTPSVGSTVTGTETVTYCNPASPPMPATCTGTAQKLTFPSTYAASPYIEVGTGSTLFSAGGTLTTTSWSATFATSTTTPTGALNQTWDEFQTTANIFLAGAVVAANINGYSTSPTYTGCTASCTTAMLPAEQNSVIASMTVNQPAQAPVLQPQTATVSGGQCTIINALSGATEVSDTVNPASTTIVTPPAAGTATLASPNTGLITYCAPASGATSATFTVTAAGTTSGLVSAPVTETINISYNQCSAGTGNTTTPFGSTGSLGTCSLHQEIVLPVTPGQIILSQSSGLPVDYLGSSFCATPPGSVPGITLNGNVQAACGRVDPVTVTNATGLDTGWTLTGQVTDFTDPATPTVTSCDTVATYSNHCIPGGNLAWEPAGAVAHAIVPGDTAQVTPGALVPPVVPVAPNTSTNPILAPSAVQPNPVVESAPNPGLNAAPATMCKTASGQAGGTFICGAGLELLIPASIANPGASAFYPYSGAYQATLTLTLS